MDRRVWVMLIRKVTDLDQKVEDKEDISHSTMRIRALMAIEEAEVDI